jgi:hypothetical protein
MSIEKKSLISTLKTTKKANIAGAPVVDSGARKETIESTRAIQNKAVFNQKNLRSANITLKAAGMKNLRQMKHLKQI